MKIFLIAIGTRGDVQPFVVLGQALKAQGHDVQIAASGGFSMMIRAAGLSHCLLPMDFQELLKEPEMQGAITTFRGKIKAYRWASEAMNEQLDVIWQRGLEFAPDLILHHFKGALGPYLASKLGAVSVPIMLQPGFKATGDYPQFLISPRSLGRVGNLASHHLILAMMRFGTGMMIRRWRKASAPDIGPGMDAMQGYDPNGKPIRIHAYSEHLVPRPVDWPTTEIQTGYLFAKPEEFSPSEPLVAFLQAGPPPVYFGFGSMPGIDERRNSEAIISAVKMLGLRAIVATGWGGIGELSAGDDVFVTESVPHSWLFPQIAAVVHHGGSGTTHEGLRWGRASVICPLFADQPFFGQRVAELGAGPAPIAQKHLNADRLLQALGVALSPPVQENAARIGRLMQAEDGVAQVCTLIEQGLGQR